jgi:hypothetical protein
MFRIHMTNFGYFLEATFDNLEAALNHGRSNGFEFSVWRKTEMAPRWSPIGGTYRFFIR